MEKYLEKHERYVVESDFIHNGLRCVVTFGVMGNRCGYIGIPREHSLYGKDYIDIERAIDYGICHGGLTYSSSWNKNKELYPVMSDLWWFGFDCAHYGDGKDLDLALEYFPELERQIMVSKQCDDMFHACDPVRDKEYVEDECRSLANQLAAFYS
jgi:hypothetical protein